MFPKSNYIWGWRFPLKLYFLIIQPYFLIDIFYSFESTTEPRFSLNGFLLIWTFPEGEVLTPRLKQPLPHQLGWPTVSLNYQTSPPFFFVLCWEVSRPTRPLGVDHRTHTDTLSGLPRTLCITGTTRLFPRHFSDSLNLETRIPSRLRWAGEGWACQLVTRRRSLTSSRGGRALWTDRGRWLFRVVARVKSPLYEFL